MLLDPRSVANLILLVAKERRKSVTNLSLQKMIYFVHGRYLLEERGPLITGSFEAWRYGPVCLPVYDAFKHFGASPIDQPAKKRDVITREVSIIPIPDDEKVVEKIADITWPYLNMSSGRLVELSHAAGSPWDRVTSGTNGDRAYGLRITNETIMKYFRFHKISVDVVPRLGEPSEESPPD